MAQGGLKKLSRSNATSRRPQTLGPRKGQRVIAPKKTTLVNQKVLNKKISAGLTKKTELNLAEKAGHLELLAGGKKDKKQEGQAKKQTQT